MIILCKLSNKDKFVDWNWECCLFKKIVYIFGWVVKYFKKGYIEFLVVYVEGLCLCVLMVECLIWFGEEY